MQKSVKTYLIVSEKNWNKNLLVNLSRVYDNTHWVLINEKKDFNIENLNSINPEKIFIPHWSYIISDEIYERHECIVFHMTDLPFGRGGSPLQNLIILKKEKTKISALKVVKELDAGPIYLKKDLDLYGTAEEIFIRANSIIELMIIELIDNNLEPKDQKGDVVHFNRRKPNESNLFNIKDLNDIYDYIRMLDADGYPKAFIENSCVKFEFSRAVLKTNGEIKADVRIVKK